MRPIMVEIRPGVEVPHNIADLARLLRGVDLEAAEAAVAPLVVEDDEE